MDIEDQKSLIELEESAKEKSDEKFSYISDLKDYTDDYLCPPSANDCGLQFMAFRIRDVENGEIIFQVGNVNANADEIQRQSEGESSSASTDKEKFVADTPRFIQYNFGRSFFERKRIGTTLMFTVGSKGMKKFRMLECHYYHGKLLMKTEFHFGFCIPYSVNTWEMVYEVPRFPPELVKSIIDHPFEVKSDSFFFEGDRLIVHNKAEYAYYEENVDEELIDSFC